MRDVRAVLEIESVPAPGRGVRVAMLGSGADLAHPGLADRVDHAASRSCAAADDLLDRSGRGTHHAGIVAGTGILSGGAYAGLAPEADLVIIKITDRDQAPEGNVIKGVELALEAGADIICFPYGHSPRDHIGDPPWVWPETPCIMEAAFDFAAERGVLCVVSAGEEGPTGGTITRPGGLASVLTVGGASSRGGAWLHSGRGPYYRSGALLSGGVARQDYNHDLPMRRTNKPDIVMPGVPVTAPRSSATARDECGDPRYVAMGGAGVATAVAAGLAAVLLGAARREGIDLGANPGRTMHRLIRHSANVLSQGGVSDFGHGFVTWPVLAGALRDYARDQQFRDQLSEVPGLQLLL